MYTCFNACIACIHFLMHVYLFWCMYTCSNSLFTKMLLIILKSSLYLRLFRSFRDSQSFTNLVTEIEQNMIIKTFFPFDFQNLYLLRTVYIYTLIQYCNIILIVYYYIILWARTQVWKLRKKIYNVILK